MKQWSWESYGGRWRKDAGWVQKVGEKERHGAENRLGLEETFCHRDFHLLVLRWRNRVHD